MVRNVPAAAENRLSISRLVALTPLIGVPVGPITGVLFLLSGDKYGDGGGPP